MNNQEIFDKVVEHARKQQCTAIHQGDMCMYRTPTGLKCFIGALIPDELYKPEMENRTVGYLYKEFPELGYLINGINIGLLRDLQAIHDHSEVSEWENEFEILSLTKDLIYTPPKEVTDNDC